MDGLLDIVGAMRSLAGMRMQETQRALPAIDRYSASTAAAIGRALLLMPGPIDDSPVVRGRRALALFAAEHGFVGGFNERLIDTSLAGIESDDLLFVLGSRGAVLAHERGCSPVWSAPMATRPAGVREMVNALTTELYARIARAEIARVEMIFTRYVPGSASRIHRQLLLPLDTVAFAPTPACPAPLHNLPPRILFETLAAEYVFAQLTGAAVESIGSENAARFAAMESAHGNLSDKVSGLHREANNAWQDEITAELLDLITGAEAMVVH